MPLIPKLILTASMMLLIGVDAKPTLAQWSVGQTFHVGQAGSWDYLAVDSSTHRLFVPRSSHTMVLDADTGRVLGDISGQKVAHGVAIVPSAGRGFITDGGGAGAIIIFDLKTYAVLGSLVAEPDADGIIYDAKTNRVLAVSGDGGVLMTLDPNVDPKSGKIDAPIQLGGKPEFLATDGNGKAYINLEDKDMVAEVDLASRKVTARWPVSPGGRPVGMALDPAKHRLFLGCRNPQKLVAMSTDDGKVVAALPIGAGVDAVVFDSGQIFASSADGTLTVASEKSGTFVVEQVVKTPRGARTMGMDPSNHTLYLPTADFEPAASPSARPRPKAGTFVVIEVRQAK